MTAGRRCPPGGTIGEGPEPGQRGPPRPLWPGRLAPSRLPSTPASLHRFGGDPVTYGRWIRVRIRAQCAEEWGCIGTLRSRESGLGVCCWSTPGRLCSGIEPSREAVWCSNASLIGHEGCWCWRRRKRACSTTASSAPSTSSWASSTRARASPPRRSSSSASRSRPCARRSRRPSACRAPRRPAPRLSPPGRRRSSSSPCARPSSSATTTSAPSTCSSAWCARARASPPRCS